MGELKIIQEIIPKLMLSKKIITKVGEHGRTEMFFNKSFID
jgi:hypothetical protein